MHNCTLQLVPGLAPSTQPPFVPRIVYTYVFTAYLAFDTMHGAIKMVQPHIYT